MARIRRFTSRVDAEVAASMLRAHGIEARAVHDDTGGMHPNLAFGQGGSEVVVPEAELDAATALLDAAAVATATPVPDDGPAELALDRSALRAGALALAVGLVLAVVASQMDLHWLWAGR